MKNRHPEGGYPKMPILQVGEAAARSTVGVAYSYDLVEMDESGEIVRRELRSTETLSPDAGEIPDRPANDDATDGDRRAS